MAQKYIYNGEYVTFIRASLVDMSCWYVRTPDGREIGVHASNITAVQEGDDRTTYHNTRAQAADEVMYWTRKGYKARLEVSGDEYACHVIDMMSHTHASM